MNDFSFYSPTRFVFGRKATDKVGGLCPPPATAERSLSTAGVPQFAAERSSARGHRSMPRAWSTSGLEGCVQTPK